MPAQVAQSRTKRQRLITALVAVLLILSVGRGVDAAAAKPAETYNQLKLFGDAFEKVRRDYVDEVSDRALIGGAIKGMLTSLDPHSDYLSAGALDELSAETRAELLSDVDGRTERLPLA